MTREISKSDDVIDSRDVIERIKELETGLADAREAALATWEADLTVEQQAEQSQDAFVKEHMEINWSSETAELAALLNFMEQMNGRGGDEQWRGDWYPVTIIRDSYFTEYAEELCNDICAIPDGFPNYIEIDWEATARNIQVDYTSVEFDGVTYWVR